MAATINNRFIGGGAVWNLGGATGTVDPSNGEWTDAPSEAQGETETGAADPQSWLEWQGREPPSWQIPPLWRFFIDAAKEDAHLVPTYLLPSALHGAAAGGLLLSQSVVAAAGLVAAGELSAAGGAAASGAGAPVGGSGDGDGTGKGLKGDLHDMAAWLDGNGPMQEGAELKLPHGCSIRATTEDGKRRLFFATGPDLDGTLDIWRMYSDVAKPLATERTEPKQRGGVFITLLNMKTTVIADPKFVAEAQQRAFEHRMEMEELTEKLRELLEGEDVEKIKREAKELGERIIQFYAGVRDFDGIIGEMANFQVAPSVVDFNGSDIIHDIRAPMRRMFELNRLMLKVDAGGPLEKNPWTKDKSIEEKNPFLFSRIADRARILAQYELQLGGLKLDQVSLDVQKGIAIPRDKKQGVAMVDILRNLIGNAGKYSDPNIPKEARWVKVKISEDKDGDVIVSVSDNGIGFKDAAGIGRARFREGRKYVEGTGFGLSRVKQYLAENGWGPLELVETRPVEDHSANSGTTFRFKIPKERPKELPKPVTVEPDGKITTLPPPLR